MREKTTIQVFADWKGLEYPTLMGTLEAAVVRGKEIFSFAYDTDWLHTKQYQRLDPGLGLYAGKQYSSVGKQNFGLFLDSCPDRWGRFLLQRRESIRARNENRKVQRLYPSDYLLGVHDLQRMGALRFQVQGRLAWQLKTQKPHPDMDKAFLCLGLCTTSEKRCKLQGTFAF